MFNELANGLASVINLVPLPGKLTLIPLEKTWPIVPSGPHYSCMFNPDSFTEELRVEYDGCSEPGKEGDAQKFVRRKSTAHQFELLIDGTGASGEKREVSVEVARLKYFTEINGKTHKPPYILAVWGSFHVIGVMNNLTITYTMFRANGTPLRAKANFTIRGHVETVFELLKKNLQSPDLTHLHNVVAGDTLMSLSQRAYGDPRFYLQLAEANGLTSPRATLRHTRQLVMPPIKKTTNA